MSTMKVRDKEKKIKKTVLPSGKGIIIDDSQEKDISYQTHTRQAGAVTLQDIADICGVSCMTVSRALRGDRRYVSETMTIRIQETAAKIGYDPARFESARRLVLGSHDLDVLNHAVALFFPGSMMKDSYFIQIFDGIITAFNEHEIALVSNLVTKPDLTGDISLPRIIRRGDVDGAIVYCAAAPFATILSALRDEPHFNQRPIISILNPMPGCSVIMTDDWTGSYEALTHLLSLGHQHILHFYGEWSASYPHQQRLGGMRQACDIAGMKSNEVLKAINWNYDNPDEATERIIVHIESNPTITAIMAPNDKAAISIWHALTSQGIRIPEDISLIGHDDSEPLLAKNGDNILTTITLPLEEIGRIAANQLVEIIQSHSTDTRKLVLPVTFTIRSTTASPKI
ncbi:MAG: LacI family DNA-binding transcriptional regulator [bacterium]